MSKNNMKPRVFLAHNSRDKSQIRVIADKLNQKGIDTWLDEEQIPPGVSFQDRIQKAIAEIDCAIIFIGKQGLGKWQGWELKAFFSKLVQSSIPLIPVLLPGVKKIPDDLLFLQELNWVQFTDNLEDPSIINKLVWGITGKSTHIDYGTLTNWLNAGRWRDANIETRRIILQSADREKEGYLYNEQMREFDSDVLLKLDRLWLSHSQNRFGFSIQKGMLLECQQDANRFGTKVGWRLSDRWIDEASVNYSLDAPIGHLPYGMLRIVELNNAVAEGIVNAQFKITKALATEKWQRQLITDFVAGIEFLTGNKNFSSGEFKEDLDAQLSHDEGWWQGERAELLKIKYLCLLLFSCRELAPQQEDIGTQANSNYTEKMSETHNNTGTKQKDRQGSSINQKRLEKEAETLQSEWDLRIEKLSILRKSLAIEIGSAIKFQLEQQIQEEQQILAKLNERLEEIDLLLENKQL
jgi:GUN4-like/TIR domain